MDLTHSFQQANWKTYIFLMTKSPPLFFAFGRMNYCQWVTIYYEKCLNLKAPYPTVYGNIHLRRFCSAPTYHKDSAATPIDQAQEKAYNKLAKGPGEVIGATQEKESVAKRDLTKDEKMKYTKFLDNL